MNFVVISEGPNPVYIMMVILGSNDLPKGTAVWTFGSCHSLQVQNIVSLREDQLSDSIFLRSNSQIYGFAASYLDVGQQSEATLELLDA
jgi:hypothetical protein